jgi:hypothetical protein
MLILSNYSGQVKEEKPARRRIGSKLLVGVGLGAMVLTVLGFLPGCGSDSTPGGSVKGKNAKPAARAETAKPLSPGAMVVDSQGTVPGNVKKRPDARQMEVLPGITQEELDTKLAEARKRHLAQRNPEVFPGITQEELDAKLAEAQKRHLAVHNPEVFPGITQEALEAKLAESRQRHLALRGQDVFPGITQEALDAKLAESRQRHDPRQMTLPGQKTPNK